MVFQGLFNEYFAGIVSEGTCNPSHLIPKFQVVLSYLHDMHALGTTDNDKAIATGQPDFLDKAEYLDILFNRLDDIAGNYGYTFSAHPDDGACFGFWKLDD